MRVAAGLLFVSAVFGVVAAGISGALYYIVSEERSAWESYVAAISSDPETVHATETREKFSETETLVGMLLTPSAPASIVALLLDVADQRKGVRILGISVEKEKKEMGCVATIRGEANDRVALVAFARMLEMSGFEGVDVPVGSFVNEKDIPFSLSFTYDQ